MAKRSRQKTADNQKKAEKTPNESVKAEAFFLNPVVHVLTIVIWGVLIYSNTLNSPFAFDDVDSIVNNPFIRDMGRMLDPLNMYGNRYVGFLTFALNYKIHGLHVAGYHVLNLVVHLLNALLVYWLMVLTFRTPYATNGLQKNVFISSDFFRWIPLFTALLFVSHPIQTQAVTYITQRFASLTALFYLASLTSYIKARGSSKGTRYAFYAVSIVCAVLAMRTKEIAFTLPVIVSIYEFMFYRGLFKKRMLFLFLLLLTMFIIPLSIIATRAGSISASAIWIDELTKFAGSENFSRWDYLNTQFRVIVTYIRLLFIPVDQNLDYDYPIYGTFFTPPVYLSFLFLLSLFCWGIFLLYRSYKSDRADRLWLRWMAFGIFWFFVTLSVESSFFPILDVIYEHRLYLPSVGFFMAIISGIAFLYVRSANPGKGAAKAVISLMTLAIIVLSWTAYARNMIWSDKVTLWEDVVRKSPYKGRPHFFLAEAYQERGHLDHAIQEYETTIRLKKENLKSIKLQQDYALVHYCLGFAYQQKNRIEDAIRQYETALKVKPDYVDAFNNLGVAYQQQGRLDDAVRTYQAALELNPRNVDIHYNLGLAYQQRGLLGDAVRQYRTVIKLKPDYADAHYYLGLAYKQQGRGDEAHDEYETAIKLKPDSTSYRKY